MLTNRHIWWKIFFHHPMMHREVRIANEENKFLQASSHTEGFENAFSLVIFNFQI